MHTPLWDAVHIYIYIYYNIYIYISTVDAGGVFFLLATIFWVLTPSVGSGVLLFHQTYIRFDRLGSKTAQPQDTVPFFVP